MTQQTSSPKATATATVERDYDVCGIHGIGCDCNELTAERETLESDVSLATQQPLERPEVAETVPTANLNWTLDAALKAFTGNKDAYNAFMAQAKTGGFHMQGSASAPKRQGSFHFDVNQALYAYDVHENNEVKDKAFRFNTVSIVNAGSSAVTVTVRKSSPNYSEACKQTELALAMAGFTVSQVKTGEYYVTR